MGGVGLIGMAFPKYTDLAGRARRTAIVVA
jgi:hypothetical protein